MDKILNKWYFGLIIVPVFVNYLTDAVGLPDLFTNWTYTSIGILMAVTIILIIELAQLNNKFKGLKAQPRQSDKKIVKELLETLDIDSFHDKIKEQDSWYGYTKSAISKSFDYTGKASLISYRTTDKKLNRLIIDLTEAIDDFNDYCSTQLYPNGNFYSPAKDSEFNIEKAQKARPVMNNMAAIAFKKLSALVDYVKSKNYLEE